jgi:hypothetical protein
MFSFGEGPASLSTWRVTPTLKARAGLNDAEYFADSMQPEMLSE